MCVKTDWENEEAVIYFQRALGKIGVDAALEEAGCVAGDEVRIAGYSFAYEGAEEYGYEDVEDEGER